MSLHCDRQGCGERGTLSCVRCKKYYYCSRECQVADWQARHKEGCSPNNNNNNKGLCMTCKRNGGIKKCSRCGVVRYCSVECQKQSWKEHKPVCENLVQMKLAGRDLEPLKVLTKLDIPTLNVGLAITCVSKQVSLFKYAAVKITILDDNNIIEYPHRYMSNSNIYWRKKDLVKWLKKPPSDLILDFAKISADTIPDHELVVIVEYKKSYLLYRLLM